MGYLKFMDILKPIRIYLTFAAAVLAISPVLAQSTFVATTKAPEKMSPRAEAYYNFTLGHLYEIQYEQTSQSEYATRSIEAYKRAYAIDPKSPIIGERLAEMYWKAQRVHDAVLEASEILKRDPNELP